VGMALLGTVAEMMRLRYRPNSPPWVAQGIASAVALLYVVSQEFGLHRLGGFNVVDPWDAAFSMFGVGAMAVALTRFGPIREKPRAG